jgi:AhpD family alkylhydroperoxidase
MRHGKSCSGGVLWRTIGLVQLRASQIDGFSLCVDMRARYLKKAGETDERLFAVAAWQDARYFTDAERAALALIETAGHYDEQTPAALIVSIATINVWNRLNVATRRVACSVPGSAV